jgi:type I restriction enzyme S subunit
MTWPVLPLRQIADVRYGISAPISGAIDADLGTPIVRMANIGLDGSLDLSNLRYYPMNEREGAVFLLNPGDLLLNWRSGSANHVGKTAIFKSDGEFTFVSFLLRIRVNHMHTSPEYLKLILNFMRSEGVFLNSQRFQVNTKLNAEEFGNFEIILPLPSEQSRIVAYLNDLQEKTDDLKSLQTETSTGLDALMPSILDKAFRGEL